MNSTHISLLYLLYTNLLSRWRETTPTIASILLAAPLLEQRISLKRRLYYRYNVGLLTSCPPAYLPSSRRQALGIRAGPDSTGGG